MGAAPTKLHVEEDHDGDMAAALTKMHVEEDDDGVMQPPPAFDYFELNAQEDARCTRSTQEIEEQTAASETHRLTMEQLRSIFYVGDKAMAAAPTKMHVEEDDDGDMQPPPAFDYFELNPQKDARCTRSTQEIEEQTAGSKTRRPSMERMLSIFYYDTDKNMAAAPTKMHVEEDDDGDMQLPPAFDYFEVNAQEDAIARMHWAASKILRRAASNNNGDSKEFHCAVLGVAVPPCEDEVKARYEELCAFFGCALFGNGGPSRNVIRAVELVNEAFAALSEDHAAAEEQNSTTK